MINLIIITHGEFGAYLVEAAEEIVGCQEEGVRIVSTSLRQSLDQIRERILKAVRELYTDAGLIVVTDMPGGTPTNAILPAAKDLPNVSVLSGLNLYMLVSAFSHRRESNLQALTQKMLEDARKSVVDVKQMFLSQMERK